MRTVRGLYQLKLAAEYALLRPVPLSLTKDSLTGYDSFAILTNAQNEIRDTIFYSLQVMVCCVSNARKRQGLAHTLQLITCTRIMFPLCRAPTSGRSQLLLQCSTSK